MGNGEVKGKIKLIVPEGLSVDMKELEIQPLGEGTEQIINIRISKADKAQNQLYGIKFVPEDGLRSAIQTLYVSVGVVMTVDRTVPKSAQFVIRAPGYTMKVDQYSGVSYYLLDADGHRRHGRIHNTNFIYGIPGIIRDEKLAFGFRHPCRFIWDSKNSLIVGCDGTYNDHDMRFSYTFTEDEIKIAVIPPTSPTKIQTMWLGNFDMLEPPIHNGKEDSERVMTANRFFFPHPVYRQGLLVTTFSPTTLQFLDSAFNFPIRVGEDVTLKFVETQEPSE